MKDLDNTRSGYQSTAENPSSFFLNYQRIYVAIEASAKCRYFMIMRLEANILLYKAKFLSSLNMLPSFNLCRLVYCGVQKNKGKFILRKPHIIRLWDNEKNP